MAGWWHRDALIEELLTKEGYEHGVTHNKGGCRLSKHSHCTVTGRDMFRHIQICWERWSDTWRSVTGATGVPARNSLRLWNKGRFWLTGSLITSSLSGQTASTVGRLLYYSHSGCFSLRENNNDKDCPLLTAFSNPSSSTCTHSPSLCVLTTVEEAGHPSSVGQGNPRKEKQKGSLGGYRALAVGRFFPLF